MRISLIVSFLFLAMGCQFDGDARYYPITKTGFLLAGQADREILAVKGEALIRNWETSWSTLGGALSDMAGSQEKLWLSSGEGQSIVEIDLETESLIRTLQTESLAPHHLCAGEQYLLLSDTTQRKIGFLNRQTESLTILELDSVPRQAIYNAPAFYLVQGKQEVGVYHETALAPLGEVVFPHPIAELAFDQKQTIFCWMKQPGDSTLTKAGIDVNSLQMWEQEPASILVKIRYSPYRTALYGKEWTSTAQQLSNRKLTPSVFDLVYDFEMDFFESRYYYLSRDSLFSYSVSSQIRNSLGPFSGKLHKSFFFIAPTDQ